ncbi:MAG: hypothetical protein NTV46_01570, partial [Verrucomicrobia bacterium]|nr:hypothetical protein [Verrucomicrobiota bacterium]
MKTLTLISAVFVAACCTAAEPAKPGAFTWPDAAPADCPFPKSETFGKIEFTGRHAEYTKADTWYFVNIPSKFISTDGTMWLCYAANWTDVESINNGKP